MNYKKINGIVESMRVTKEILAKVSENNTQEIFQTGQLRIILFNLQIIGAGIPGVDPIADRLRSTINSLHDGTDELVKHDRSKLLSAVNDIDNFLNELLSMCVFKHIEACQCSEVCYKRILLDSKEGQKIKAEFDAKVKSIRDEFKEKYKV